MTKLLIDENLPQTLVHALGGEAIHARELGARMSDLDLWRYARTHDCILVTKDTDFFDRLSVEGSPPKVVWVRTGNRRRSQLEAEITRQWPEILGLLKESDLVEIHADRLEGIRFK